MKLRAKIGRPTVDPERVERAVELIRRGIWVSEAARLCGVSRQTLTRYGALRSKLYEKPDAVFISRPAYRPYGETMMDILLSAVPEGTPPDIKEEIVQQMAVEILSGSKAFQLLREQAIKAKQRVNREYHNGWSKKLSLDAPFTESGLTLAETLEG